MPLVGRECLGSFASLKKFYGAKPRNKPTGVLLVEAAALAGRRSNTVAYKQCHLVQETFLPTIAPFAVRIPPGIP
jgi:hypothetical protein